jgi:hypothetical protein
MDTETPKPTEPLKKPIKEHTNGKHDVVTHRVLVASMAAVVLVTSVGSAILAAMGIEVPHSMSALGYTAIGGLSGMLVSIMKGNGA